MAKIREARRCRARRRDGQPCRCYAIVGGFVCRAHGGTLPAVKRKARERVIEAGAYRALAAWLGSPAGQEAQDRAALAHDWPVIEALAGRLG